MTAVVGLTKLDANDSDFNYLLSHTLSLCKYNCVSGFLADGHWYNVALQDWQTLKLELNLNVDNIFHLQSRAAARHPSPEQYNCISELEACCYCCFILFQLLAVPHPSGCTAAQVCKRLSSSESPWTGLTSCQNCNGKQVVSRTLPTANLQGNSVKPPSCCQFCFGSLEFTSGQHVPPLVLRKTLHRLHPLNTPPF